MKNPDDLMFEKRLPAAPEAEKFVLAAALLGHPIENITAALQASDFSIEKHRRIFAAMAHLEFVGSPVDRLTVYHELSQRTQGHRMPSSLERQTAHRGGLVALINTHFNAMRRHRRR